LYAVYLLEVVPAALVALLAPSLGGIVLLVPAAALLAGLPIAGVQKAGSSFQELEAFDPIYAHPSAASAWRNPGSGRLSHPGLRTAAGSSPSAR
jgi:hypothetical protein